MRLPKLLEQCSGCGVFENTAEQSPSEIGQAGRYARSFDIVRITE
jgi:hypothetical protein